MEGYSCRPVAYMCKSRTLLYTACQYGLIQALLSDLPCRGQLLSHTLALVSINQDTPSSHFLVSCASCA